MHMGFASEPRTTHSPTSSAAAPSWSVIPDAEGSNIRVASGIAPGSGTTTGGSPSRLNPKVDDHLADLRAHSGLTTEQLIYAERAAGWLMVPALEPRSAISRPPDPGLVVTVEAAGAWLETSSETA